MNADDEFDVAFKPCEKLCKEGNIKIGSDVWYTNFIQEFFNKDNICDIDYIVGMFSLVLGYDVEFDKVRNFDTFKGKVEIKEDIIDKMDKSIVDMNVGDIIKFNASELESIFVPQCDQKTQLDTGRINFFTDCAKSLILCLYVKNKFHAICDRKRNEHLKQILIDTFLNMLVHFSLSSFLVNCHYNVNNINFIERFCAEGAFDGLHLKLYDYICKFLIKNDGRPLNLQQQTEYIETFLNITLKLDGKNVKLSDKIKLVDEDLNIIELDSGKIPKIGKKELYFEVVGGRFKKAIILNSNIFDDKHLQVLKFFIDTKGNIKSVNEEDQLSLGELNHLNKLSLGTKLFSNGSRLDLICILFVIYLKRKYKISDITDDGIKDILKSFFSEMLKDKNEKSIKIKFKNLKTEEIPDRIYSQLAKISVCCNAGSQESFWRKEGDDNNKEFLSKIKTEQEKLKNNKDRFWNWIQTGLFVTAINEKIGSNKNFKDDLNRYITNSLPEDRLHFQNLDTFAIFLPTTLKNCFTKEKIRNILGEKWANFTIEDDYLEELYMIDLTSETKTKIIQKFNITKATSNKLKNENDVKKAIDTFKKILGKNKVSPFDFRNFIYQNIAAGVLSSEDMDGMLNCVSCDKNEDKDVFTGLNFWNALNVLKDQPSEKFINFMVPNTPFNNLKQIYLIININILMQKHPAYQQDNGKEGMITALQDILTGKKPYQEFSEALLKVERIAEKINYDNIIHNIGSKDWTHENVLSFVRNLMFYGIKIKLEGTDENKKFTVCKEEHQCSNEVLIELLSKEQDLNNWLRSIFATSKGKLATIKFNEEENKNLAKTNSILLNKKITTLDNLAEIMSKPAAIKNFINNSKDSERSKKIYKPLLDNDDLLNNVPLNKDTVEWCMNEIRSNVDSDSLTFDKKNFEKVKTSLESWNVDLKDKELKHKMFCSIVALFFENVEKCSSCLRSEEFISMVAEMIQKPELNIYLDKYKKNFFSYMKEQLLKIKNDKELDNCLSVYIENKNRDLEINRLQQESKDKNRMDRIYSLKQSSNNNDLAINNLQQTISFYKWLYLFAIVPVLGWIFCAILYFYFHKPCLNRLGQLRQNQETISKDLSPLETTQKTISNKLNQLMQERTESREQSEQLKRDCQILLSFIDSKEQMPPENIIIDNEQNKQNDNLLNAGAQKPLSENNIITIENKF